MEPANWEARSTSPYRRDDVTMSTPLALDVSLRRRKPPELAVAKKTILWGFTRAFVAAGDGFEETGWFVRNAVALGFDRCRGGGRGRAGWKSPGSGTGRQALFCEEMAGAGSCRMTTPVSFLGPAGQRKREKGRGRAIRRRRKSSLDATPGLPVLREPVGARASAG